jgi:hypothetical protein
LNATQQRREGNNEPKETHNMYRVNYGNGQVTGAFPALKMAREQLEACDGYSFMERLEDNGEYFPCNSSTGRFLDMTDPRQVDKCKL